MNQEEFRQQGHTPFLKAFLDSPSGAALISVIEDYGKPSNNSRKQYGDAEDVKLQMSLNYVAMEQTFAVAELIRKMVTPIPTRVPVKPVVEFLPDDATPEMLKARGVPPPEHRVFAKPVTSESEPAPSHARRRRPARR